MRKEEEKKRKEKKKDGEAFLEDSVMTVATFPPCRKRIAPFPLARKCGNKALPARGLEEVVTTGCSGWGGEDTVGDISMNFVTQPFSP